MKPLWHFAWTITAVLILNAALWWLIILAAKALWAAL